jgi:hypothetical protein
VSWAVVTSSVYHAKTRLAAGSQGNLWWTYVSTSEAAERQLPRINQSVHVTNVFTGTQAQRQEPPPDDGLTSC